MTVQGEATGDVKAMANHLEDLATIIHDAGHTEQQIFGIDKVAFYWMKMLSRTSTARQKSVLDSKASKTGQLLIGANAAVEASVH